MGKESGVVISQGEEEGMGTRAERKWQGDQNWVWFASCQNQDAQDLEMLSCESYTPFIAWTH